MAKNKEDFFKLAELPTVDVEVDGFGVVRLRQISELERYRKLDQWLRDSDGKQIEGREEEIPYRLLTLCAHTINDDGSIGDKLFDEDDLGRLVQSSSAALLDILQASIDINTGEPLEKK